MSAEVIFLSSLFVNRITERGWFFMKFGERVGYGPQKSELNFGNDPEHILF